MASQPVPDQPLPSPIDDPSPSPVDVPVVSPADPGATPSEPPAPGTDTLHEGP